MCCETVFLRNLDLSDAFKFQVGSAILNLVLVKSGNKIEKISPDSVNFLKASKIVGCDLAPGWARPGGQPGSVSHKNLVAIVTTGVLDQTSTSV